MSASESACFFKVIAMRIEKTILAQAHKAEINMRLYALNLTGTLQRYSEDATAFYRALDMLKALTGLAHIQNSGISEDTQKALIDIDKQASQILISVTSNKKQVCLKNGAKDE